MLEKVPYSSRPLRHDYLLTEKGWDFGPALRALKDWGKRCMPHRRPAGPGTG